MKKNQTRRALLMSALSLLLCVSMLVGTTFAWFTDSVTSGRNTIQAGNLDVVLEYWDGNSYEEVTSTTKLFDDAALWEPGYTEVAYLKVSNAGSLALKYQLAVSVYNEILGKTKTGEDIKLSDHLQFKVVESDTDLAGTYGSREAAQAAPANATKLQTYSSDVKPLDPKDGANDEDYVALIIYMPTSVDNRTNHDGVNVPKIEMGVNLFATQQTAESDSFNDQYDKNAIIVTNAAEAQAALDSAEAGATIRLAPGVNYGTLVFGRNASSQVVDISNIGGDETGNERYSRYENITILGAAGATVDQITFDNGKEDANTIWNYIDVKNLTIKNVTFSGASNAVWIPDGFDIAIDGLSLVNCKMTDTEGNDRFVYQPRSGYKTLNDKTTGEYVMTSGVKNLTITGCEITGAHQVIEARAMENLTITNNTFNGIKSRDILLGRDSNRPDVYYTGTITITGNTSINGEERFVRGAGLGDANVVIKDNTILSYKGKDADYIKVTDGNNVTIANNTIVYGWNGIIPTAMPDSLVLEFADEARDGGKVIVKDDDAFVYLNKLVDYFKANATQNPYNHYYYNMNWSVELEADINLMNIPIDTIQAGFFGGGFDGKGHTISNVVMKNGQTALFNSKVYPIKNLTVENIVVNAPEATRVAAVLDMGGLENVHVVNANVIGGKYVGGLVGQGSNFINCSIKNSVIVGTDKTVGGLVGYCSGDPDQASATGNVVENVTVTGAYNVGGMFGQAQNVNVDGNTVKNVTVTSTKALPANASANEVRTAEVAARSAFANTTIGTNTVENVTLENK